MRDKIRQTKEETRKVELGHKAIYSSSWSCYCAFSKKEKCTNDFNVSFCSVSIISA
jgi:hypothetical protein